MEYPKIKYLLDNPLNQSSEFRTKSWVEINDDSCGTYNTNSPIKSKMSILKSGLCDYSDACIHVNGSITITSAGTENDAKLVHKINKGVILKSCPPLSNCMRDMNNTQVDSAEDSDVGMLMYNLLEYSNSHSETFGSLWQYCRDRSSENIVNSKLFVSKIKITGKTPSARNTADIKIALPLNYLSSF